MHVSIYTAPDIMGAQAAHQGAKAIRKAIEARGEAHIILATGASQFDTLAHLVQEPAIDWSKVTMFHLDEYVGLSATHPASFRKYLQERFVEQIPKLKEVVFIHGEAPDPEAECRRVGERIVERPIDVAFIGIGENGHLAFNDPPADFETEAPYLVVDLDDACRQQQVGEGWFASLDEVPPQAISMGIRQILKSHTLIVSVPDKRKAQAVLAAVEGPITNTCPASILREHGDSHLFLDEAASMLMA